MEISWTEVAVPKASRWRNMTLKVSPSAARQATQDQDRRCRTERVSWRRERSGRT